MLPDLPKKKNKKEADFGLQFREWFFSYKHLFSDAQFELKQTLTDKFYLKKIEDKQWKTYKGLVRITVATKGTADYMYVHRQPLYICIKYPKAMYIIPIENLSKNNIYLTSDEAKKIAAHIIT